MTKDLLLEIGLEEIPAHIVLPAMEQLKEKTTQFLKENRLPFKEIEAFSTPRRLAVRVLGIADKQESIKEEIKGPAKKIALDEKQNWTKASKGFARSQGFSTDDIFFKEIKGVEYVYVTKFVEGFPAFEVLTGLKDVITSLTFPVSMRWADYDFQYIRPLHWIVAMLDEEVIPFSVLDIQTNNFSRSHRLLNKEVTFAHPAEYLSRLAEADVIVYVSKRKAEIIDQIQMIAHQNHWVIDLGDDLLTEVVNLVEYPTAFVGEFAEKYLAVPEEVLITSMKEHQRFFYVRDAKGRLSPHFISVRNGRADHLKNVIKGNQKVLVARLEDAKFFWEEDQKLKISNLVEKLTRVTFHEKIGTLSEHMKRTKVIAKILAEKLAIPDSEKKDLLRAADIYKFDLLTNMVGEFPGLQGTMGEKYAVLAGEGRAVGQAIREHYLPAFSDGALPKSNIGAILAIADKIEALYSFFSARLIPSGSNDPYALRRSALGIIRIIGDRGWKISFADLQETIFAEINNGEFKYIIQDEVLNFIKARMKKVLQQKEVRYDLIEATLGGRSTEITTLMNVARVLQKHVKDVNFKPVMESLTRVVNLAKKADIAVNVDPLLFENDEEKQLYETFKAVYKNVKAAASVEEIYKELIGLQQPIDVYFENTFVNVKDKKIKANRYSHLVEIAEIILNFANVEKIIVK
ncbi:MAG: glycine--tRNA ligase subunit beta [Streptococcaceae bacterium]|jgi:glycyl-tRNA synthetase beta chain|nr:glycine--tRNA ligase subunit beta [Streptococcaceae bacterium]